MGNVVTWPCIHSIVVVTSPMGVHAPPALAAMTTTAPRSLNNETKHLLEKSSHERPCLP